MASPITYCPPTDGTVKGCQANCQCVYAGQQSQMTQCMGQCVQTGGGVGVGVDTQAIQQSLVGAILAAIVTPLEQALPGVLERVGLFLFALVLLVVGFVILKG